MSKGIVETFPMYQRAKTHQHTFPSPIYNFRSTNHIQNKMNLTLFHNLY